MWWIIQQNPPPCVSSVGHQYRRSSVTDNMSLPHEECLFINGTSNFAAGLEAFCCAHPNKQFPNKKTTFKIVIIFGKRIVSTTGNALVLWQCEHNNDTHCWRQANPITTSIFENAIMRKRSIKTVCHQAYRQLCARPLDSTLYISYKPVLQVKEFITAISFVVFCVKYLQAGLLYFYSEAWLHLSGCINSPKEYKHGVLQTHIHCIIILCIRQNSFSAHSISKKNCGAIVLWRDSYSRKMLQSFDSIHWSVGRQQTGLLVFSKTGAKVRNAKEQQSFLQGFFGDRFDGRGLWPPRSPDSTPPDFFLWRFSRSLEILQNQDGLLLLPRAEECHGTGKLAAK